MTRGTRERAAGVAALTVAAAALVTACTHHGGRPHPDPTRALREHREWLAQLPSCAPEVTASAVAVDAVPLDEAPITTTAAFRGILLPMGGGCTEIGCDCCNGCGFSWGLAPRSTARQNAPALKLLIQRPDEEGPIGVGMSDCALDVLERALPGPDVIVAGTLRVTVMDSVQHQGRISDAVLCVIH
jgi:hypothetical protein